MTATAVSMGLPAAAAAAPSPRLDRVERGIITRINDIRSSAGLPRVRANRGLNRSADFHSADMVSANFFAHSSSNGQSFFDRVESFRPSNRIGETLAYVPTASPQRSAGRIVEMWMNSPPHREALLNPTFRRIGVARRKGTLGGTRVVVFTADLATAH